LAAQPDPRDPGIDVAQATLECLHLGGGAAVLRRPRLTGTARVEHLELDAETVLEALLSLERLSEQDPVSIVKARISGVS